MVRRRYHNGHWTRRAVIAGAAAACTMPRFASAEEQMFEDFEASPETRWSFFADGVMGGVSTGQVTFQRSGARSFARLQGQVSTENRGGFIQFRRELPDHLPDGTQAIRMLVRGNDQRYFVHLRTTGTVLPWQYYQAGFDAGPDWAEVELSLDAFAPSGRLMRATPAAKSVTSIGIVAFGRDHKAEVDVAQIAFV